MSKYKLIQSEIRTEKCIVDTLKSIGISSNDIEIHKMPQFLNDYAGNQTSNKANVIVRRQVLKKLFGTQYPNDLGFERVGKKYKIHLSDDDEQWWNKRKFIQKVTTAEVLREAKRNGLTVQKIFEDDVVKIHLTDNN
jgi:hypothetical protein